MKMISRFACVLTMVAVACATLIAPAKSATRLLEVRNMTDYILHFTYSEGSNGTARNIEVAVMPGGTWGLSEPGMYWFEGSLQKTGAKTIPLQKHGILLKADQGVLMVLLAVYDDVGSHSHRWFVYIKR